MRSRARGYYTPKMGEDAEAWLTSLKLCISETVVMRHPHPMEHIARMLVDPSFQESLGLPTAEYVQRHNLEERITNALGVAGFEVGQVVPSDMSRRLSELLLADAKSAEAGADPKQQAHPIQAIAIAMLENQLRKTTEPSAVRALLASLGTLLRAAQERLIEVEVKRPASSRAGYLVPLDQLMPRSQQTWQEEWPQLSADYYEGVGAPEKDVTWVQQHESLDAVCQSMHENIEFDKSKGWPHEDSVAMNLLSNRRAPIALNERTHQERRRAAVLGEHPRAERRVHPPG